MSISKSQLDALSKGLLDNIGVNANDPDLKAGNLLEEILQNVAQTLTDALRDDLTKKELVASQNLRSSIDPSNAVPIAEGVSVSIVMADYWEQVDKGQPKGTIVKVADLEQWLLKKRIAIKTKPGQSVIAARRSFATAIAAKIKAKGTIKRFGYKGANFIKDVLTPQNIEAIAQHLSDMAGRKIELYISTEQK
jgi:hypothetical protein